MRGIHAGTMQRQVEINVRQPERAGLYAASEGPRTGRAVCTANNHPDDRASGGESPIAVHSNGSGAKRMSAVTWAKPKVPDSGQADDAGAAF
jgi:hypothetical protein